MMLRTGAKKRKPGAVAATKRAARARARGAEAAPVGRQQAAPARARLEVDERRDQLVRLGIDLFAARSYDDVSIDELARAAGISKGLLYHYFPTKRDFYVATVREAARQLLARTATPDEMAPLDRVRAGLDAYLDYVDEHAPAYAALLRGGIGADPEVTRIVEQTREQMFERLLEGLPDRPGVIVSTALRAWVGFVEAASLEWVEKRAMTRDVLRDLVIEVLLATVNVAVGVAQRASERKGTGNER